MKTINVSLVGVGGQGILLTANMLARTATIAGMDVKKATKDTMDHVQNALIAITLVLSAFRPHGVCRGHQWAIL